MVLTYIRDLCNVLNFMREGTRWQNDRSKKGCVSSSDASISHTYGLTAAEATKNPNFSDSDSLDMESVRLTFLTVKISLCIQ